MPEIKRNFTKGKMNQDLDLRLVPPGEYRSAMNIEISTTDGKDSDSGIDGDIGVVQNIRGNEIACSDQQGFFDPVSSHSFTVGSISDEINNDVYWLVSGTPQSAYYLEDDNTFEEEFIMNDFIIRQRENGTCEYVFVDNYGFQTENIICSSGNCGIYDSIFINDPAAFQSIFGIAPGWTVQGYSPPDPDNGQPLAQYSNVVEIQSINWGTNINFSWNFVTSSTPVYNQYCIGGNPICGASKIAFDALQDFFTGDHIQASNNVAYLLDFTQNVTDLIGSTLEILPYDANNRQEFIILDAFNGTLTTDTQVFNVVKLKLDSNITPLMPPAEGISDFENLVSSSFGPITYSLMTRWNSIDVDGRVVSNTPIYNQVPDGTINLPLDTVSNYGIAVGDNAALYVNGTLQGYCVGSVNGDDITLVDCNDLSGPPIIPGNVGASPPFINTGTIVLATDIEIILNNPLDLSDADHYKYLRLIGDRVLNFNHSNSSINTAKNYQSSTKPNYITGINIVDDMLYWVDGYHTENGFSGTEHKKINISRSVEGTRSDGTQHTLFINPKRNMDDSPSSGSVIVPIKEEHITVIKKAPTQAPTLKMVGERPGNSYGRSSFDITGFVSGDDFNINIFPLVGSPDLNYKVGDVILIKQGIPNINVTLPLIENDIRVVIKNIDGNEYSCNILSIRNNLSFGLQDWTLDLDKSYEKIYKLKFPRFAIRYKYQDGEYSSFGPFSEVAFIPGPWRENTGKISYLPNTGYNIGMENTLRELTLENIIPSNIPDGVVQVDILYKESDSTNIYTVDEIKKADGYWDNNSYLISKETIKNIVPPNQLLRSWDNVPKTARSQEITGNRIVYGNYLQNYDIKDHRVDFDIKIQNRNRLNTLKSIKSLRNYQIGVVYTDKYNRQTPVLSGINSTISVSKLSSGLNTQLEIKPKHSPPPWATHQKFYIKETSSEYYNLSLDRYFEAEDGNVWLSFASNDRNKLDLDTSLYLKKKFNSNDAESSNEKYKILDIKDEAPEYIKTRRSILGKVGNAKGASYNRLFTFDGFLPVHGEIEFKVKASPLAGTLLENFHLRHNSSGMDGLFGAPLSNRPLFVRISSTSLSGDDLGTISSDLEWKTDWYEIDNVTRSTGEEDSGGKRVKVASDNGHYIIRLKKPFGKKDTEFTNIGILTESDDMVTLQDTGSVNGAINLVFEVAQDIVQNKAVFQGRFFVKILKDSYIQDAVVNQGEFQHVQVVKEANFGYLKDFSQEDPDDGSMHFDKLDHQQAIDDFNNVGFPVSSGFLLSGSDLPPDGDVVPNDSYWGHSVWWRISNKLMNLPTPSMWVIDEAFSVGEEPLWGTYGNENQETDPDGATKFGGFNFESSNDSSRQRNQNNHGNNTNEYNYFSIGAGVRQHTIDLSYISPGRNRKQDNLAALWWDELYDGSDWLGSLTGTPAWHGSVFYETGNSPWEKRWNILGNYADENDILEMDQEGEEFARLLVSGNLLRFKNDPNGIIYKITRVRKYFKYNYTDHNNKLEFPLSFSETSYQNRHIGFNQHAHYNRRLTYRLDLEAPNPGDFIGTDGNGNIGYDPLIGDNTNATDLSGNSCPIQIVAKNYGFEDGVDIPFPENPAVFETEPKENIDLNIYNEISDTLPLNLLSDAPIAYGELSNGETSVNPSNGYLLAPSGSTVTTDLNTIQNGSAELLSWNNNIAELSNYVIDDYFNQGQIFYFQRPDGTYITLSAEKLAEPIIQGPSDISRFVQFNPKVSGNLIGLGWHNCYSFGNGVESNRIRDTFNSAILDKGPKASTTFEGEYKQEHRKYGLIYSGIYNSISGINNLNQFIQAEKITKDINPTYGSIQKLHSRSTADGDLIALCEDRILKILANKDAVYNADGNPQLVATENVLGQTIPYSGDYGISRNPESFASDSYRLYFADPARGAVLRLSRDGLTPISDYGMRKYFQKVLGIGGRIMTIGSFDDKKQEYNLTIGKSTITYKEDVKGWVSFKSYITFNGISCNNEYYTSHEGKLYKHHSSKANKNTFYGDYRASSIIAVLNDAPGTIKTFRTVNYEGSRNAVSKLLTYDTYIPGTSVVNDTHPDKDYYNLNGNTGWELLSIKTNLEKGIGSTFLKKEGKYFTYVKGQSNFINNEYSGVVNFLDHDRGGENISFQGLGMINGDPVSNSLYGCTSEFNADGVPQFNYDSIYSIDDNSCYDVVEGCLDPNASNYDASLFTGVDGEEPNTQTENSCFYIGCTDPLAINYDPNATSDDGSCIESIPGCTDDTPLTQNGVTYNFYVNYDNNYNTPCCETCDGSDDNFCCEQTVLGCMDPNADNHCNNNCNTDDGSCTYPVIAGCTDPTALNYDTNATTDDGSCVYIPVLGCTDETAINYNPAATIDDGGCIAAIPGCTDATAFNYDSNANTDDGSCIAIVYGCTDPDAFNYDANANTDDSSCVAVVTGCTDPTAYNYDPNANVDNSSCIAVINGCTDSTALNFDPNANVDDGSCVSCNWGCTDPDAYNWDANASCDDGSCYGMNMSYMPNTNSLTNNQGNDNYWASSSYTWTDNNSGITYTNTSTAEISVSAQDALDTSEFLPNDSIIEIKNLGINNVSGDWRSSFGIFNDVFSQPDVEFGTVCLLRFKIKNNNCVNPMIYVRDLYDSSYHSLNGKNSNDAIVPDDNWTEYTYVFTATREGGPSNDISFGNLDWHLNDSTIGESYYIKDVELFRVDENTIVLNDEMVNLPDAVDWHDIDLTCTDIDVRQCDNAWPTWLKSYQTTTDANGNTTSIVYDVYEADSNGIVKLEDANSNADLSKSWIAQTSSNFIGGMSSIEVNGLYRITIDGTSSNVGKYRIGTGYNNPCDNTSGTHPAATYFSIPTALPFTFNVTARHEVGNNSCNNNTVGGINRLQIQGDTNDDVLLTRLSFKRIDIYNTIDTNFLTNYNP